MNDLTYRRFAILSSATSDELAPLRVKLITQLLHTGCCIFESDTNLKFRKRVELSLKA